MPSKDTESAPSVSAEVHSGDGSAVSDLVAQMSRDDRTIAIPAGRELWKAVRRAGEPNARDERVDVESRLRLSLEAKQPNEVHRDILWMLSEIGGDESVDIVAAFLTNRDLREDARMALERISGEKALTALWSAFDAAEEDFKPNIVQSLRARGERIDRYPCQKLVPVKGTDVMPI